MQKISEFNLFLRVVVELPQGLMPATREFHEGWNLVQTTGARLLEKKIQACGWLFDKTGDSLPGSGVGDTAREAVASALKVTLGHVDGSFNAAVVKHIELSRYPWFFLARVRVCSCRILESAMQAAPNDAVYLPDAPKPRLLPPNSPALYPEFGAAMPLLKQMLVCSRRSEARPQ